MLRRSQQREISAFCASPCMQKRISSIRGVFTKYGLCDQTCECILDELMPMIIPAGVKAKRRGDAFNECVKGILLKKYGNSQIKFEKPHKDFQEIPDWICGVDNVTIVGYNQLDVWSGGHQVNRGGKYIMDDHLHRRLLRKNIHVVCVVDRSWPLCKNKTTKVSRIIDKGRRYDRLCQKEEVVRLCQKIITKHNINNNVTQQSQQRRSVRRSR